MKTLAADLEDFLADFNERVPEDVRAVMLKADADILASGIEDRALQAGATAGAEDAAHAAADLGADADGPPVGLDHKDALDVLAVLAAEQQLVGAIGGDVVVGRFGAEDEPIGVKLGPTTTPDDALALAERLNPDNEPGRLTLFGRFGAEKVGDHLPALVRAVKREG